MDEYQKLAENILNGEMELRRMKESLDEQKERLAAFLCQQTAKEVVVAGVGSISYVKESLRTTLDAKIARERLEQAGLAVPLNISKVKAGVRVFLNK